MKVTRLAIALAASAALAACATTPRAGPAQVVSFVATDAGAAQALGQGTIFVETAPGIDGDSLQISRYKAAVARELVALGYTEAPRDQASQIAQVRVDRLVDAPRERRRGPVSVGVGGSTGSFGSGVGLGLGINLGGNGPREIVDTQIGVMIRDRASMDTLWEGRAGFEADARSALAETTASADALAAALFAPFPGATDEPIIVDLENQ